MSDDQHKKRQISLGYVALGLLLVFVLQFFMVRGVSQEIPYSEFKQYVEQGMVRDLSLSPTDIRGTLVRSEQDQQAFVTNRVEDPGLVSQLEEKGIRFTGRPANSVLGSLLSWILPIIIIVAFWNFTMRRMQIGGPGILNVGQSKARLVADKDAARTTFKDVAGIEEAKEELVEVVEFLRTPNKFEELGGRIPKGVLLVGAPGTGKTLLAKAVAGEAGVPFFNISGSEFVEMFVGVGAARVRDLFAQAKGKAPCIIFIDELDALGKVRGFNPMGGHDEREQTLNQLLVEMDGFDTRSGVIIMAATNRPEILDPALLRPGRFDRQVVVDRPDLNGREAILKIHSQGVKLGKDVDLNVIASRTPGMVGADLANIVNEAALLAARRGKKSVTMHEFEEAIDRVIAGLEKKKRLISPKEKKIVAFHEAGHAVVAETLPNTDVVHKISIVPRGVAALGYTVQLPTEDRYLMTRSELEDRLAVLLAGRITEEVVFGDVSTGAQNDLMRATDIARAMVKEYGMSGKLGLMTYERPQNPFLRGENYLSTEKEYSDKTAAEIDEEVRRILDDTYHKTRKIIEEQRPIIEELANLLLEKEVVDREEFKKLLKLPV
ncbi:MAG: ATP-dependent zinc metalloprotease FtsH [Spirochaetales bacterium]|nr:ATP-dependent zinc metalloprotease FtsH [Spirochaetales bacterium]